LTYPGATPLRRRPGFSFPWRPLLLLIVILGLVYVFFCSSVRVSTGSMEPTIHGDPIRGDKLLVFNPWFTLTSPDRFELALLERPDSDPADKLMVKRIAALPGEMVRIDDGDLYVTTVGGAREIRVEKSYKEFRPLLIRRFFERFGGDFERHFIFDSGQVKPIHGGAELTGGTARPDVPTLSLDPKAVAFDDGWMDANGTDHPGDEPEHDLLFDFDVATTSDTTCLEFSVTVGANELHFDIVPYASGHSIMLSRTTESGQTEPYSQPIKFLTTGTKHRLEFFHIDGQAGVTVDERSEMLISLPPNGAAVGAGSRGARNAGFSVWAGGARITRFGIWRDIHYTEPQDAQFAGHASAFRVPQDSVFVLGDHSEESTDSRFFGPVPLKNLRGRPFLIQSPSSRFGLLH
jgi:signal peptidase I